MSRSQLQDGEFGGVAPCFRGVRGCSPVVWVGAGCRGVVWQRRLRELSSVPFCRMRYRERNG